ncbi:MAG: hypothetical protein LDL56_05990 [Armatimonadetes bacterium]|jgi:hypothetical protein|nr:hypothetical protein [Armatimonadota bacterium]MCA1996759.1 hypothetical protein [Armatimonadota bacterium]
MKRWIIVPAVAASALGLFGCGSSEEAEQTSAPSQVAFEGTQDPSIVGVWAKEDGKSKYTFNSDGTYAFDGVVQSPGGTFPVNEKGQWAVKDGEMRFKRPDGVVLAYTMERSGDTLKLVTKGSLKNETKLRRAR